MEKFDETKCFFQIDGKCEFVPLALLTMCSGLILRFNAMVLGWERFGTTDLSRLSDSKGIGSVEEGMKSLPTQTSDGETLLASLLIVYTMTPKASNGIFKLCLTMSPSN